MLWDFSKWLEYRGGHISGVPLYTYMVKGCARYTARLGPMASCYMYYLWLGSSTNCKKFIFLPVQPKIFITNIMTAQEQERMNIISGVLLLGQPCLRVTKEKKDTYLIQLGQRSYRRQILTGKQT